MRAVFQNYRALSVLLFVVAALSAGFLLSQWSHWLNSPQSLSVRVPLEEQITLPLWTMPDKSAFDEVVLGSLFTPSRRGELRAPVGRLSKAQGNVILTAVIITPDSRVALLRGRDKEAVDMVEEGGWYKGWLVKKVTDIAVVLGQNNQEQIIILERYAREFEQRRQAGPEQGGQQQSRAIRLTPSRFNVQKTDNTDDLLSQSPMELLQRAMEQSQQQGEETSHDW